MLAVHGNYFCNGGLAQQFETSLLCRAATLVKRASQQLPGCPGLHLRCAQWCLKS